MPHLVTEKLPGRQRNRRLKDYAGQRFGMLVALALVEREPKENNHLWRFRCDCGNEKDCRIKVVRSGHATSCGCRLSAMVSERNATHGLSRKHPREYRTWKDMRGRCNTPGNTDFPDYGGRGIKVCDQWSEFAVFLSDMGERPSGKTIDRIDVNGDYEPGNCRWADGHVQANNRRSNHNITIGGVTRTLQQWCDLHGVEPSKARWRISQGWAQDRIFSKDDFRVPS
jgi:hypothetical protein